MTYSYQEIEISGLVDLLKNYCFESNQLPYEKVLATWLETFPLEWVNLALVESLHQGRYKVISVQQILTLWQRRGQPSYHFNHDFERLVSNNLPRPLTQTQEPVKPHRPQTSFSRPRGLAATHFQQEWHHPPKFSSIAEPSQENTPTSEQSFSSYPGESRKADVSKPIDESEVTTHQIETDLPSSLIGHEEITQEPSKIGSDVQLETDAAVEGIPHLDHQSPREPQEISEHQSYTPVSPDSSEKFHLPIHQFVPQSKTSEFCAKLTAMAQVNV